MEMEIMVTIAGIIIVVFGIVATAIIMISRRKPKKKAEGIKTKVFVTILSKHPISKEEIRTAIQGRLFNKEIEYVKMFNVLDD
ncbi:MAG: hypothetical protein KAS32_13845 [Candidatus Peribacteraceae bacterium]|nr:hypothetical protein [Candidatus Peribacteraceae bacterium]